MQFNKPPLTFLDQVDLLISRGLNVRDKHVAAKHLSRINYYRLSAYRFPFCEENSPDQFKEDVTFENLWNLYCFDREFRLHLLDAIERIEVAVRTVWANTLALNHGSHAYENPSLFYETRIHESLLEKVDEEVDRSHEEFITHYRNTYTDPKRPSIWAICEILSLGTLSKFYSSLKDRKDRKLIADKFLLDDKNLKSFLQHITVVRNFCAHHSRVWNRRFPAGLKFPRNKVKFLNPNQPKNIYNTLVMILHFMKILCPESSWRDDLKLLLTKYPEVEVKRMGFPNNWCDYEIWNDIPSVRI